MQHKIILMGRYSSMMVCSLSCIPSERECKEVMDLVNRVEVNRAAAETRRFFLSPF